jgi:hypothetical protein
MKQNYLFDNFGVDLKELDPLFHNIPALPVKCHG